MQCHMTTKCYNYLKDMFLTNLLFFIVRKSFCLIISIPLLVKCVKDFHTCFCWEFSNEMILPLDLKGIVYPVRYCLFWFRSCFQFEPVNKMFRYTPEEKSGDRDRHSISLRRPIRLSSKLGFKHSWMVFKLL